jgi:hypothetical protein
MLFVHATYQSLAIRSYLLAALFSMALVPRRSYYNTSIVLLATISETRILYTDVWPDDSPLVFGVSTAVHGCEGGKCREST